MLFVSSQGWQLSSNIKVEDQRFMFVYWLMSVSEDDTWRPK